MLADRAFLKRLATLVVPVVLVASSLLATGVQASAAPAPARSAIDKVLDYVAPTTAPFDGTPISHGLGPTYGETWCGAPAPGSSIANQQGAPLALVPYESFGCLLQQFKDEAVAAGVPARMTFSVIGQSDAGRNVYGVVVNAMETPEQITGYNNWLAYRAKALTDPVAAQALLASYGANVKVPIFVENNIHGDEEEGGDSMMQILRDLVTTPRGVHPTVDNFLDHAILITIPNQNPDGRFIGQRANANGYDMNRDYLVQSQPEVRANIKLETQWLAPVMLATHGYVNPTLIDGLTKPHNPGLEYDIFVYWNQRRLDANQAALARVGQGITRPVNGPLPNPVDATLSRGFCANGGSPASNLCATYTVAAVGVPGATQSGNTVTITTTAATVIKIADTVVISGVSVPGYNGTFRVDSVPSATQFTYTNPVAGLANAGGGTVGVQTSPNQAEGWDDLGPFYTQTYGAFFGVDGSTLEMCSSGPGCNGRLGSKIAQYVGFYSSADFWVENREAMLADQVEMFVRGVNDADRPNCCDDPLVASRGFTEAEHNWMTPYPTAYIIPMNGGGQRSDAEANRMAQWLLDNGITLERMTADFTWGSTTYPAGSYVVPMDQPMRGLALTALSAGQDFSVRINQLYAPPGGWSHGLMWGADTVEVPRDDASFTPATEVITAVSALTGGVAAGPADWYSVTPKGVRELQVIYDLLRDGVYGEIAEAPFVSTSGGPMPAGSLIFANDPVIVAALDAAGAAAGVTFERNVAVPKPPTTRLSEAPKVAILANANAAGIIGNTDTRTALKVIFGDDAEFVSLTGGPDSVQNSAVDPLLDYDVIYNTGQGYPVAGYTVVPTIAFGATSTATAATITTAANHSLAVGSTVTVAGVTHAGYNGDFTVASVPNATTFTYAIAGPLPSAYGGTVTRNSVPITATGATWNVGTGAATVTTAAAHGQVAGATVTISGVGVAGYNGTFTTLSTTNTSITYLVAGPLAASGGGSVTFAVPPAATAITFPAASSQGTTASITTTAAHNLTVGAPVTISGVAEAGYNGTFTVTAVPTTTRFSYTTAGSDLPVSSGGSVSVESRARVNAFFARGGGYIATNTAATLTFLTGAAPALVPGTFTSANAAAGGGTGIWSNVGGAASPLTGAFPATDFFFLPSNITYFNSIPTDAVADGRYLPDMVNANPRGPSTGFVAGLWLNRTSAASVATNNAAVIVHGTTTASSRYTAIATNPFSRSDFERIWGWIVQSALWSNLTDEAPLDQSIDATLLTDKTFGDPDFPITATATSGLTVSLAASGKCTVSSPTSPATIHITGAGSCTVTASQAGTANYNPAPDVVQTITIAKAPQSITFAQPASPAVFGSSFTVAPTASSGLAVTLVAAGGCTNAGFVVTMTSGTVDCTLTASQAGNDDYLPAFDEVRTVSPQRAVLLVTPNPANPSRQYSDANPAIAAVITGYVNGDDAGDPHDPADVRDDRHAELTARRVPDHLFGWRGGQLQLLLRHRSPHGDPRGCRCDVHRRHPCLRHLRRRDEGDDPLPGDRA